MKYLIDLGHCSIAHICGEESQWTAVSKLKGYKQALIDAGFVINENLICEGNYTVESGYRIAKKILHNREITAIFVANDSMTLGVYKAANELGIRIPEDVSVIGFDDIEVVRYLQPSLTTVRVPLNNMAIIATDSLFEAIEEKTKYYTSYNIPVELKIRQSCKKVNNI